MSSGRSGGNLHEAGHDVNGHGEDNCAIVLRGDPIQGLEIPELQTCKYSVCTVLEA